MILLAIQTKVLKVLTAMTNQQKLRFFRHLVQLGFKEIEVAYPAASETDYNFVQELIDRKEVPDDVWIQASRCIP